MATIKAMKRLDNAKVIMEVMMDSKEALKLQGHTDNIHLITENIEGIPSRISLRGKNEATKYFLIPKSLRSGFKLHYYNSDVNCHKIQLPNKVLFIYTLIPKKKQIDGRLPLIEA